MITEAEYHRVEYDAFEIGSRLVTQTVTELLR